MVNWWFAIEAIRRKPPVESALVMTQDFILIGLAILITTNIY